VPAGSVTRAAQTTLAPGTLSYVVFLQSRPVGREEVAVVRQADGWTIRGSNRLAPPLNVVTQTAEIHYTADWRPTRMLIEGTTRGQQTSIKTTFAGGQATSEITVAGQTSSKTDPVAPDTIVLPNAFLGSYAALARRLAGAQAGASFRGYIAPQAEVPIRLDAVATERIETAQRAINATRYSLTLTNPGGELQVSLWAEPQGGLLRLSVPAQSLEVAREDIASAASRTTSFSLPTDEPVRIPSIGFNLAGSLAKPPGAAGRLPAIVLIGGSGHADRDATAFGIPIMGEIARGLVEAGFLVVRYDKRGAGQSGGRAEGAVIGDYAEDVRSTISWLEKRPDVDKRRIGIVGHDEGAWAGLAVAARDKRVKAVALIASPSTPGAMVVLEQQARVLERSKAPDAEAKVELQKKINAAVLGKGTWEGVPEPVRKTAETPWFHSYLSFDPARLIKDVRQPMLIVQGELDTQVPPHHADKLAELARARKHKVPVDVVKVPGVNHLLVPAKTGEADEYASLADTKVSTAVTSAIADWMAKHLPPPASR
jgi:pimeloyl-ACP methyl ester carboxylesterase